jgi:hypothetical protein
MKKFWQQLKDSAPSRGGKIALIVCVVLLLLWAFFGRTPAEAQELPQEAITVSAYTHPTYLSEYMEGLRQALVNIQEQQQTQIVLQIWATVVYGVVAGLLLVLIIAKAVR